MRSSPSAGSRESTPASTDTLYTVQPLFSAQECVRFLGLDYEIRQRCGYRFESLVLHEMNAWEY